MSEKTRKTIRRYVDRHGRGEVAEAAMVSEATVKNWLRPAPGVAHRQPTRAGLALLAQRFGDSKKKKGKK